MSLQIKTDDLLTEQANPASGDIDLLPTTEILRLINDEDKKVAVAVEREIPRISAAVEAIAAAFAKGGRLVYIGAGTSGRLGVLDAAECPPTFGVDAGQVIGLIAGGDIALTRAVEGAEDDQQEVVTELKAINLAAGDIVVGIAASGRTPYVLAGLVYARSLGAFTIAVSCSPNSAVEQAADLAITPLVGPEIITGSTRLKAGTATKLVLNMLTTAAMIKRGKVYKNLMVDVQPTNAKLLQRAERIVAAAAGASRERAADALKDAGQNVKLAIVMLKCGCSADAAVDYLAASDGFIRKVTREIEEER